MFREKVRYVLNDSKSLFLSEMLLSAEIPSAVDYMKEATAYSLNNTSNDRGEIILTAP